MRCARAVTLLTGILIATAAADVVLVQDRLSMDALAWVNSRWQQTEALGFVKSDFMFYRFWVPVGLTGYLDKTMSLRVSFDAGWNQRALDIYVDANWPSGFGLRAGQFIAPLGFEALTPPRELKFIEYSLVKNAWKLYDPRDVGLMGTYGNRFVELDVAVVNGNGKDAWLQDDNKWKDVCGRMVFKPFEGSGMLFALRAYYGRIGAEGTRFRSCALELDTKRGPLDATCELQNAVIGPTTLMSFYARAAYRVFDILEPVARLQMSFGTGNVRNIGITGGLNFPIRGDVVKVMLDYDYRRQGAPGIESDFTRHQLLLQLQAAL